MHPLVVPSVHLISTQTPLGLQTFIGVHYFCSNAARAPDTSQGSISNQVLAPSLCSVANWVLPHFVLLHLGGRSRFARPRTRCSVTSFLRTSGGGAISLRSTAKWVLPRFAPSHPGGRPHFARSLTIIRFPLSISLVWGSAK